MHCNICDKMLTEKEISFNDDLDTFDPCSECLEIALDAAYCDGFQVEDDSFILIDEEYTMGDASDIVPRWGSNDE